MSLLSKLTDLEYTGQFKLIKVPKSDRVSGFLINKKIPKTL